MNDKDTQRYKTYIDTSNSIDSLKDFMPGEDKKNIGTITRSSIEALVRVAYIAGQQNSTIPPDTYAKQLVDNFVNNLKK